MKNKVEEIMKNYRNEVKKIDKKYEVKDVKEPEKKETIEIDQKIQSEREFIEKLKFEGEDINQEMIQNAQARLEAAEKEKKQIDIENEKAEDRYQRALARREEKLSEMAKLRNSKVKLESGREVSMAEKDEMDKSSLRDKAIKELTAEGKSISEQLKIKEQELETKKEELQKQREEQLEAKKSELEQKRNDLFYFKYEFNENHEITNKADHEKLNKDCKKLEKEIEKLEKDDFSKQLKSIKNEVKKLKEAQEKCNEYLTELKEPSKQLESFSSAWHEARQEESQRLGENQGTQQQLNQQEEKHSITANEFMQDMLRIQQTTGTKEFDELSIALKEKYADSSDTWANRILAALDKQKGKIQGNIDKSKSQSKQPEKQKDTEGIQTQQGNSGRTEAERLADVLSGVYKKKAAEEIGKEDEYEELDFDIPSIFGDKDNDIEEDEFEENTANDHNITISRIEVEEATGYVKAYDDDNKLIYNKQFEYDKEEGFLLIDEYESNEEEINRYIEEKIIPIKNFFIEEYGEEDFENKLESIDSRIFEMLVDLKQEKLLDNYMWSIFEKDETMPFQLDYNLKDIYNSDMTLEEIDRVQEISKTAQKQNKDMVNIKKDNILKRAFGRITKGIQERRERKLLYSGNNSQSKLKDGAKRIIKGVYKEARIQGMYLKGKLTRENPLKTKSKVREFSKQYEAKVDETKARESMEAKAKEEELEKRDNFDIDL